MIIAELKFNVKCSIKGDYDCIKKYFKDLLPEANYIVFKKNSIEFHNNKLKINLENFYHKL